jgi:hypothetical protein
MRIIINIKQRTGNTECTISLKQDAGVKDKVAETNLGGQIYESLKHVLETAQAEDKEQNDK